MAVYSPGNKVLYRQPRCACTGGGFSENFGTITDIIKPPNGTVWYKISTDYQGTYVVEEKNVLRIL